MRRLYILISLMIGFGFLDSAGADPTLSSTEEELRSESPPTDETLPYDDGESEALTDDVQPYPFPYPRRPYPPRFPRRPYPYAYWQCTAWDVGYEEHRGGHVAYGYSRYNVYYRALNHCQYYHGRCYVSCFRLR